VDDGVREGDTISPFYDSMVAKLIVHGDTREQALARLDEALAQTHIVGLATNVQFLRHVVRSASFAQAKLDTALIPREQAVLFHQQPVGLPLAVAAAVAQTLVQERAPRAPTPSARPTAGAATACSPAALPSRTVTRTFPPRWPTCTMAPCA
jgi:3-methylcrotonyl-CoA carboxylase alpha subunit